MSKRWLLVAAALVGALLVGAVAVALVTTGDGDLLSEDSPEGVVQRYLLALEKEDYGAAYDLLSGDLREVCSVDELALVGYWPERGRDHVTLEKTESFDDRAVVRVRVTVFSPGVPLGDSEYSYDRTFHLKLEDGQWRLTGPDWWCPHPRP